MYHLWLVQIFPESIGQRPEDTCTIPNVLNCIVPYYKIWYEIGLHLNLPVAELDKIRDYPVHDRNAYFVELWYRHDFAGFSWSSLARALSQVTESGASSGPFSPPLPVLPTTQAKYRPSRPFTISVPRDFDIVKRDIRCIDGDFTSLIIKVERKLDKEKNKEVGDVLDTVNYLPPGLKEVYSQWIESEYRGLDRSESHREFFTKLNRCWNFLDFQLLERIIEKQCDGDRELKTALQKYREDLQAFCKSTTVYQLIKLWKPQTVCVKSEITGYKRVISQLGLDPKSLSVFSLDSLREEMSDEESFSTLGELSLSNTALFLYWIVAGSVTMMWLVAEKILSLFTSQLVKSHTGFVDRYQITFLSVDEYIVHSVAEVCIIAYRQLVRTTSQ